MKDRNITVWPLLGVNFWGITKCANSTMKIHLYELENNAKFEAKKDTKIHKPIYVNYISEEEALQNNLTNFTITRNPYDRFVSIYRDMVKSRPRRGRQAGLSSDSNIDQVLSLISEIPNNERDVHLRTQYSFIPYTQITKIDVKDILSKWPLDFPAPNFIKNKSSYTDSIQLTEEQRKKVYEIYKEDFVYLDYEK